MESRRLILINQLSSFLINELNKNIKKKEWNNFLLFVSIFIFLIINNFIGLFPYVFTATTHLPVSLSLRLINWLTFIIYGWINCFNHIICHLVPLGTPIVLSSFIVLIETISNIIRPLTLRIRLSANLIAGHLLLTLLSGLREKIFIIYIFRLPVIIALLFLEIAVSVIQSYVFITLIRLYFREI